MATQLTLWSREPTLGEARVFRMIRGALSATGWCRLILLWWGGMTCLCLGASGAAPAFSLALDVTSERAGVVMAYYDHGDGFWNEEAVARDVPPGAPTLLRFPLPSRPLRGLRIDPAESGGTLLVRSLQLQDASGAVILDLLPAALRPIQHIESIRPEGRGVRVVPAANAEDPQLRLIAPALQRRLHEASGRRRVGTGSVVMLALMLAAIGSALAMVAARALGRGHFIGGAMLFLFVSGARLAWLHACSRPVPFWDEWDGDALYALIPFHGGFLDWGTLVMPQWEHRILVTRVITLFGTLINGEWDVRIAMACSAAMYAGTVTLVGLALLSRFNVFGAMAALLLASAAALPFDFNNLLWGGQTQMYALLATATALIGLAAAPRISGAVQWAAAGGAALSLFTMGSGTVAPACMAGICLARAVTDREQRAALLRLAAIGGAAALVGLLLHTRSRAHAPFYATSVSQSANALSWILAWPLPPRSVFALLIWTPWVVHGVGLCRRRSGTALDWMALGLGGWALIIAAGLAYARHYEGPHFDSRFFTALSMGAVAAIACMVALWERAVRPPVRTVLLAALVVVVGGWLVAGLRGIGGARDSRAQRTEMDSRIRQFFATGDARGVLEKPPAFFGTEVVARLEEPLLQQVLPAPYRQAIAARTPGQPRPEAGWLTIAVRTLMKSGVVLAGLGLVGYGLFLRGRIVLAPKNAAISGSAERGTERLAPTDRPSPASPPRWLVPMVALAGCVAFLPTLGGGFLADDFAYIARFAALPWSDWPALFRQDWSGGIWGERLRELRPFVGLSFMGDGRLFGGNPLGYRVTNLALHLFATSLVARLAWRYALDGPARKGALEGRALAALVAGVVFAFHPAHAEAVGWITGRVDVQATTAALLYWTLAEDFSDRGHTLRLVLACLALFLGMFSKELCLFAPGLLALRWVTFSRRPGRGVWRRRAILFGLTVVMLAVYLWCRRAAFGPEGMGYNVWTDAPAWERQAQYAGWLVPVLPFTTAQQWQAFPSTATLHLGWMVLVAVIGLTLATALWRRAYTLAMVAFFGGVWYLVTVFPMTGVVYFSPRHLYFPSVGLAIAAGLACGGARAGRWFALAATAWVVAAHGYAIQPWRHAAQVSKDSLRALDTVLAGAPAETVVVTSVPETLGPTLLWAWSSPDCLRPPFLRHPPAAIIERPANYIRSNQWGEDRQPVETLRSARSVVALHVDERGRVATLHLTGLALAASVEAFATTTQRSGLSPETWTAWVADIAQGAARPPAAPGAPAGTPSP